MHAFWGELLGTMTMILLGNGVVAGVSLKGSYGEGAGWVAITTGWGLAVICAVLVALAVGSNAHLNPAVTIGVSIVSGDWSQFGTYVLGQMLGTTLGSVLVWLHYLQHWGRSPDAAAKRACFSHVARDSTHPGRIAQRDHRHVRARVRRGPAISSRQSLRPNGLGRRGVVGPFSGRATWSGESGSRSAGRPGTRSIPRATSGRASRTRGADRGEGIIGLGLRGRPDRRSGCRRGARGPRGRVHRDLMVDRADLERRPEPQPPLAPRHHDLDRRGDRRGTVRRHRRRIAAAGPAILVVRARGRLVVLVMRMLGEMAAANPTSAPSPSTRPGLGRWAGFSSGWLYWYFWVVVVAVEAIAGAKILESWIPAVWQMGLALMVVLTAMNLRRRVVR